jgi:transposase InsO family protein
MLVTMPVGAEESRESLETPESWLANGKCGIRREYGLDSVTQRRYRPFRHYQEMNPYKEDLVKQKLYPEGLNVVWVADIAYIKTKHGFVYLAIVMDLGNRVVNGYATSQRIETEPEGTIFHSNRVTQFAGAGFHNALMSYKMLGSMFLHK